jgi:hypothetical protein
MGVIVGKGGVELMVQLGCKKQSCEFAPDHDLRRWLEAGYIPVSCAVVQDYRVDLPDCKDCDNFQDCLDAASDKDDAEVAVEQSRMECTAVDTDKLLKDIKKIRSEKKIRAFLSGEPI